MDDKNNPILKRGLQDPSYTFFDKEVLTRFAESFYKTTGIPTSLHTFVRGTVELQSIHVGSSIQCSICTYLRQECFYGFRRACFENNHLKFAECLKTGKPIIYRCHMDLCEAIIPLKQFGDERSVIYLGRVDPNPASEEGFQRFIKRAVATEPLILKNSNAETLRKLYYAMPRMSEERFADATALAISYAELINFDNDSPVRYVPHTYMDSVRQYVRANLHMPLNREIVAEYIGISAGYLSHIVSKEMGCSFSEYVTKEKMEFAKELLSSTSLSVNTVAIRCGYDNPKYFYTLFKKHTGMTAGDYRKHKSLEG